MNRLIFSAFGVILTFIWIIYTAPDIKTGVDTSQNRKIKTINRSGSTFLNKITPVKTKVEPDRVNVYKSFTKPASFELVTVANSRY
ncbi:MAG: hypothetical protein V4721_05480 [Bacteroidota bacterium]